MSTNELEQARALFDRALGHYRPKTKPERTGPLREVLRLVSTGETLAEACRQMDLDRSAVNGIIRIDAMYKALYEAAKALYELQRSVAAERSRQEAAERRHQRDLVIQATIDAGKRWAELSREIRGRS